jgi:hypothetical protein
MSKPMSQEDRNLKIIREIMTRPENKKCFDCTEKVKNNNDGDLKVLEAHLLPSLSSPLSFRGLFTFASTLAPSFVQHAVVFSKFLIRISFSQVPTLVSDFIILP